MVKIKAKEQILWLEQLPGTMSKKVYKSNTGLGIYWVPMSWNRELLFNAQGIQWRSQKDQIPIMLKELINMQNMLTGLKKNMKVIKKWEIYKSKQMKDTEMKTIISKTKISLDEITSMVDNAEENIS